MWLVTRVTVRHSGKKTYMALLPVPLLLLYPLLMLQVLQMLQVGKR